MSRFIGKRVFYICPNCGKPFTISKKTPEINGISFCCEKCMIEDYELLQGELQGTSKEYKQTS